MAWGAESDEQLLVCFQKPEKGWGQDVRKYWIAVPTRQAQMVSESSSRKG